jgi:hypothetical protein
LAREEKRRRKSLSEFVLNTKKNLFDRLTFFLIPLTILLLLQGITQFLGLVDSRDKAGKIVFIYLSHLFYLFIVFLAYWYWNMNGQFLTAVYWTMGLITILIVNRKRKNKLVKLQQFKS